MVVLASDLNPTKSLSCLRQESESIMVKLLCHLLQVAYFERQIKSDLSMRI